MVGALQRGLTLQDFEILTVGMLVDYICTYNDAYGSKHVEQVRVRTASQQDYDHF